MKSLTLFLPFFLLFLLTPLAVSAQTVVITEIMYNPASSETNTETQYIEIVNVTDTAINLQNWTIDDEDGDGPNTLPNIMLPARSVAVITGSSEADFIGAWDAAFLPGATIISLKDLGQIMFNISNSPSSTSEIIVLKDNMANTVDEINLDDAAPWPVDSGGPSIYLNLSISDLESNGAVLNDNGGNWLLSEAGTDGSINNVVFGTWNGIDTGSPGNYHGGGLDDLFVDGFEQGDASAWSGAVP